MCNWTNDAQRLLLEHFDTIQDCPSQIYHSALQFCPSSSWLQEQYGIEFLNEVKVVRGLPAEWGTCSRTVPLNDSLHCISYWNNTVAVGSSSGDIILLNTVTGSQTGILSGHSDWVLSIAFSSDGVYLVSGSYDKTVKLWDMQTGGVIKEFAGHDSWVWSVCISPGSTMIASGSGDGTVRLWDIQTGECHCVIQQDYSVDYVSFLPMFSQQFISISGGEIQQWDINGHQIGSPDQGSHAAFSPDGAHLAVCHGGAVTVQNIDSKAKIAEFSVSSGSTSLCCFSPDGRLVAASAGDIAYVWDVTSPDPYPIEVFIGHTGAITALTFSSSSSLISASDDKSVKFWQIGTSVRDPVEIDSQSTIQPPAEVLSITLQAADGITITSDSDGVVMIWDIFTGNCRGSFQTPVKTHMRDVRLIGGRLILVWYMEPRIHIWDVEKQESLIETPPEVAIEYHGILDLKISGDGSAVFYLHFWVLESWSIQTGAKIGMVTTSHPVPKRALVVEGSRVWTHYLQSNWVGWDFKVPGSPIQLPNTPPNKLHPNGTILWNISQSKIQDRSSERVLFQLGMGHGEFADVQWNGHHLVVCFRSGKVLVLDCSSMLL